MGLYSTIGFVVPVATCEAAPASIGEGLDTACDKFFGAYGWPSLRYWR